MQDIPDGRFTRPFQVGLIAMIAAVLVGCSSIDTGKSRDTLPKDVPDVPASSRMEVARTAFDTGNFGFAARYYEMAMQTAPTDMVACLGLAASYDWLYRFDLSDPVYSACGRIDGDKFLYHNNVGFSHLLRGDLGKAAASLAQANSLRPGHPVVATNLRILRDASNG